MKRTLLGVCALLLAAPLAFARGGTRGFTGARGVASGPAYLGRQVFSGGRASPASRGFSGTFSRALGRTAFSGGRAYSASRSSFGSFSRALGRPSFVRSTSFRVAARPAGFRRLSGSASNSAPPAWATPGAKIVSAGQPPVYSQAPGGGTFSVEGGGFIAMDQSKANDVGRAPGLSWGRPDKPPSIGGSAGSGGGGTGASANGPAFDPSF